VTAAAGSTEPEKFILGIESSCDDTGVAVVSTSGRVLGESLATQTEIHAAWGGVVPKLAQEAHEAAIDACVDEALTKAGITPKDLDAVAVTIGPGLSLCLRVGVLKAREVAAMYQLPVIPVHHMEAHALVARLTSCEGKDPTSDAESSVQFPFMCVLVSGGHNLLMIVEGVGRYIQLGTTLDDALGEAYDKVARLLGLELKPSGGAALEALALEGDPTVFKFTTPLQKHKTCDFSYAGLKTGVRMRIEEALGGVELPIPTVEEDPVGRRIRADIAAAFQTVAVRHLEERCRRALQWAAETHPEMKQVVVAGGVASNKFLRGRLADVAEEGGLELVCPPPRLCTDNGVMVGWAGVERWKINLGVEPPPPSVVPAEGEWVDLRPRWPLTDRKDERSIEAPRSAKKKNIFESLEALTAGRSV
jgi:N6-L-threonylcarbamoyladenine synthase